MLIEGAYTEVYWQLTCPSRCSLWFSTSVKTEAVILLHLYLYAWLLRTLWNTVGPSNRCGRGAGVCMGGQMPRRRPNQVSGPLMSHPIGMAVHSRVTKAKGRIENKEWITIVFFPGHYANLTRQEDKGEREFFKVVHLKRMTIEMKPFLTSATIIIHVHLDTNNTSQISRPCLKQRNMCHLNSWTHLKTVLIRGVWVSLPFHV